MCAGVRRRADIKPSPDALMLPEMGGSGLDVARLPERRQASVAAGSSGTRCPGMGFVAAANIGNYTCAASVGPPCPQRLREHGRRGGGGCEGDEGGYPGALPLLGSAGSAGGGPGPDEVEIAPRVTLCVSQDGEAARRSVTLYAAHYLSVGSVEQSGLEPERFRRISRLAGEATGWYFEPEVRYSAELDELITPDQIERFAVAGTPRECLHLVWLIAGMGYDSISMNVAAVRRPGESMYSGLRETVEGLGEMMAEIRCM